MLRLKKNSYTIYSIVARLLHILRRNPCYLVAHFSRRLKINLQTRIAVEHKIVRRVVKDAIKAGYTVSVFDGEEWTVKRSTEFKTINDALFSTDEDTIRIRDAEEEESRRYSVHLWQ